MTEEFQLHIASGCEVVVTARDGSRYEQAVALCGAAVSYLATTEREQATCARCRGLTSARWEDAARWFLGGHDGLSATTMLRCALGVLVGDVNHPWDIGDFRRCLRLLDSCSWVRDEFPQIAALSPAWEKIIRHWDALRAAEDGGDYFHFDAVLTRVLRGNEP